MRPACSQYPNISFVLVITTAVSASSGSATESGVTLGFEPMAPDSYTSVAFGAPRAVNRRKTGRGAWQTDADETGGAVAESTGSGDRHHFFR